MKKKKEETFPRYMYQVNDHSPLVKVVEKCGDFYRHVHFDKDRRDLGTFLGVKEMFRECTEKERLQAIVEEEL